MSKSAKQQAATDSANPLMNPLSGKTYADADAFAAGINDLASAKIKIALLARMILLLERRITTLEKK